MIRHDGSDCFASPRPALPEAQPMADLAARDGGQVAMTFETFAKSIGTYFWQLLYNTGKLLK
jgi:hypothetical protein